MVLADIVSCICAIGTSSGLARSRSDAGEMGLRRPSLQEVTSFRRTVTARLLATKGLRACFTTPYKHSVQVAWDGGTTKGETRHQNTPSSLSHMRWQVSRLAERELFQRLTLTNVKSEACEGPYWSRSRERL